VKVADWRAVSGIFAWRRPWNGVVAELVSIIPSVIPAHNHRGCAGPGSNFLRSKYVRLPANTDAGGGPAAAHFLCSAKESKQRKASPGSSPVRFALGFPALLRVAGHSQNSGSWLSRSLSLVLVLALKHCSRTTPATLALLGDSHGALAN
jgi:hypothetical protein